MYLDNGATTPLSDETKQYLISVMDMYYNPSSVYQKGSDVRQLIENVRKSVKEYINASDGEIIFTCGGSASNTLAIKGYINKHPNCTVLYSPIAHKSILKCVATIDGSIALDVNVYGNINILELKEYLSIYQDNTLVVIDYANSEIGTIQNVKAITELVHSYNGRIYWDCTGSISQIPTDVDSLKPDMIGFSAHKIGGLKGCGVLYKAKEIELEPLVYGSQEHGLFGGTENVLGIASLGKAIEQFDYNNITSKSRDYVYEYISKNIPNTTLVGGILGQRLPHNLYICFKGVSGEALMILLDNSADIQVSTGSACTSQDLTPSTTLTAINVSSDDINSCIRFTFSGNETQEELDLLCRELQTNVDLLRHFNK